MVGRAGAGACMYVCVNDYVGWYSITVSNSFKSDDLSFDRHHYQQQQQQQKLQQKQLQPQKKHVPPPSVSGVRQMTPPSPAVIKPSLNVKKSSIAAKEPGWYRQLFQQMQSKVDDDGQNADHCRTYC